MPNLSLQQNCHEKTRQKYAEETILERQAIATITTQIVSAELGKSVIQLVKMTSSEKAHLIAHATQMAFAIAGAVTAEDERRYGKKIDQA